MLHFQLGNVKKALNHANFLVVYVPLTYNIIIGRPTKNSLKAVPVHTIKR